MMKVDRKTMKLLIALVGVVFAAVVLTAVLSEMAAQETGTMFPASTLNAVPEEEPVFLQMEGTTLGCPDIPYDICLPGEIADSTSSLISAVYDSYFITLVVSDDTADDVLVKEIGPQMIDCIDVPSSTWTQYVSGTGYINSYKADYLGGIMKVMSKMKSAVSYAVLYGISFEECEEKLFICISCDNPEYLDGAKELLDAMMYTLALYEDDTESVTEEPEGTEAAEGDAAADSPAGTESTEQKKAYQLYIKEDMEKAYIVFQYDAGTGDTEGISILAPNLETIFPDESLGRDGRAVFCLSSAMAGTYYIYVNEAPSGVVYEALSEERYLMIYGAE